MNTMDSKSSRPTSPFGLLPRPVTTSETPRSKSVQDAAVNGDKDSAKRSAAPGDSEGFNPYQYGAIQLTGGFFNQVITTDLPEAADEALCHDTLPPGQVALGREAKEAKVSTTTASPDAAESSARNELILPEPRPSEQDSVELNQSPPWLRPKRGLWLVLVLVFVLGCAALAGFLVLGKGTGTSPLPALVERPTESKRGILATKLPPEHNPPRKHSIPAESAALTLEAQPRLIHRPSPLKPNAHAAPPPPVRAPKPTAAKPPLAEPKPQSTHDSSADELYFDPE